MGPYPGVQSQHEMRQRHEMHEMHEMPTVRRPSPCSVKARHRVVTALLRRSISGVRSAGPDTLR